MRLIFFILAAFSFSPLGCYLLPAFADTGIDATDLVATQRDFLNRAFQEDLSLRPTEWFYSLSKRLLQSKGVGNVLRLRYDDSVFAMLFDLFPEKDIKPWLFKKSLRGIWNPFDSISEAPKALQPYLEKYRLSTSADFHRHVLNHALQEDLSTKSPLWFYDLQYPVFADVTGLLAARYNNSFIQLVYTLYPDKELRPWYFKTGISGMWQVFDVPSEAPPALQPYLERYHLKTHIDFQRHVLDVSLGFRIEDTPDQDVYKINTELFTENSLGSFLTYVYSHSVFLMLTTLYPERDFKPWLFKKSTHLSCDFSELREAPYCLQPYLKAHGISTSAELREHICRGYLVPDAEAPR